MTIGELRKAIADLDDSLDVLIRWNSDTCSHVAGVLPATVEQGCTDTPALMLDADTDESVAEASGA